MADQYKNTIKTWKKLASAYQEKFNDLTLYDQSYEAFISYFDSNTPSILEVGCGPGTITKWLKNHLPTASILATDVASEMIEEAQKHVDGVQFKVLDAREIDTIEQKFDAILAGFCIPYLTMGDLEKFIASVSKMLNQSGIFYISCDEKDHSNSHVRTGSTGDKMMMHYYLEEDILPFFNKHQIQHLETIRVNYPLPNGESDTHLIILGKK